MSNTKKSKLTIGFDQNTLDQIDTTAGKIRYLSSMNISRGDISRILDIKYQWVRNVLITPLKK